MRKLALSEQLHDRAAICLEQHEDGISHRVFSVFVVHFSELRQNRRQLHALTVVELALYVVGLPKQRFGSAVIP